MKEVLGDQSQAQPVQSGHLAEYLLQPCRRDGAAVWTAPAIRRATELRSSNMTPTKRKGSHSQTKGRALATRTTATSPRRMACSEVRPTRWVAMSPTEPTAYAHITA